MRLVLAMLAISLSACGQRVEERPGQIQVWCNVVSRTDSGERRYCGKACFATVYVITYECPQRGAVKQ